MHQRLCFLLVLFYSTILQAQELDLQIKVLPSFFYGETLNTSIEGAGISLTYLHPMKNQAALQYNAGAEVGIGPWASQVLLQGGIRYGLYEKKRWSIHADANILQGLALFKPYPLYIWGGELKAGFCYNYKPRNKLQLQLGLRYSNCPAYKQYGGTSVYLDFPIALGIIMGLGQKVEPRNTTTNGTKL